jgi:hypothetical protein
MFNGCTNLEYLDISNFRGAGDMLYNATDVFRNLGHDSVGGVINIGMLYMDTETCVLYAEKLGKEVSDTVGQINIYVQDADPNECDRLFYDDTQPSNKRIKFIPYVREEKTLELPASLVAGHKLYWDSNLRSYFVTPNDSAGYKYSDIHEKIKIETYPGAMFVNFNPYVNNKIDATIQVSMKEKIEEESEE